MYRALPKINDTGRITLYSHNSGPLGLLQLVLIAQSSVRKINVEARHRQVGDCEGNKSDEIRKLSTVSSILYNII
jgi:hypothetical protein